MNENPHLDTLLRHPHTLKTNNSQKEKSAGTLQRHSFPQTDWKQNDNEETEVLGEVIFNLQVSGKLSVISEGKIKKTTMTYKEPKYWHSHSVPNICYVLQQN